MNWGAMQPEQPRNPSNRPLPPHVNPPAQPVGPRLLTCRVPDLTRRLDQPDRSVPLCLRHTTNLLRDGKGNLHLRITDKTLR